MKAMLEKDIKSLHEAIYQYRKEIFDVRTALAVGQSKDTAQLKKLRKSIAQARTAITMKQRAGQ